ncbi:putative membrane protein YczE [Isoptericola jiangsuensis]|uniref:Putative membrane protein YczE n=1 Tax=Isoptericola jiangsuensis TaxID=548579 RepID=A0A2A9EYA9_9MICO|nr:putative membrane protein YczE [Isoptericola jiangsuensis]
MTTTTVPVSGSCDPAEAPFPIAPAVPSAPATTTPATTPGATTAAGPVRRGVQLLLGLLAFTASMAMLLHAGQGAMPWDVLHQGLARTTGWSLGVVVAASSVLVLAAWIPLRQRPGVGTLANVAVISLTIEPFLRLLEAVAPHPGPAGAVALAAGAIVLNGVATAAYVGAHLGPGPRDGLLTGVVARTGWSVRLVKTGIEVAVVAAGWALGGTVGWATVAFALGVGPVVQLAVRSRLLVPSGSLTAARPPRAAGAAPSPRTTTRQQGDVPGASGADLPRPDADAPDRVARRAAEIARALDVVRAEHGA